MYTLDLRETNILRYALGRDGSAEALDLLGVIPASDATDLSPRQASLAVDVLEGYARGGNNFGGLAADLARDLRHHQAVARA